jgi:hypothetical protein
VSTAEHAVEFDADYERSAAGFASKQRLRGIRRAPRSQS